MRPRPRGALRFFLRREGAGSAASGEIEGQRPLALHQPVRDIFGHRVDQSGDTLALADGDAAVARVLQETIDAAVAPHLDEADMVDEEARALAMGEADVEEIAILRHLGEHRGEMVAQNFEPGDLGFAQIGEHVGALRIGEASAPQRAGEVGDARLLIVRRGLGARGGGACARNAPLGDRRRSGVAVSRLAGRAVRIRLARSFAPKAAWRILDIIACRARLATGKRRRRTSGAKARAGRRIASDFSVSSSR